MTPPQASSGGSPTTCSPRGEPMTEGIAVDPSSDRAVGRFAQGRSLAGRSRVSGTQLSLHLILPVAAPHWPG